jgi:hypothetical protein
MRDGEKEEEERHLFNFMHVHVFIVVEEGELRKKFVAGIVVVFQRNN